jgi:hypothetical protein
MHKNRLVALLKIKHLAFSTHEFIRGKQIGIISLTNRFIGLEQAKHQNR